MAWIKAVYERYQSILSQLDDKDPAFAGLRGVRDNVSRELRSAGIGAAVKHTNVITYEEEQMLKLLILIHQVVY